MVMTAVSFARSMMLQWQSLCRNTRGSTAVALALAAPALVGGVGVAIDFATWSHIKGKMQAVADTAAIAGAKELLIARATERSIGAVVASYVDAQGGDQLGAITSVTKVDEKLAEVHVQVEQAWTPMFAQLLDSEMTPVRADATAKLMTSTTKLCVLALDGAAPKALNLDKNAVLRANGCGVYANSNHHQAIKLSGNSEVIASLICAVGGVAFTMAQSVQPEPLSDCPEVPDPLADRVPPNIGPCDHTTKIINGGNVTLKPGVYCGGLVIENAAEVSLLPGVFVMKNGPLLIDTGVKVTGRNIGVYFAGKAARFECLGNASIQFSGPIDGPMAGLLFFEDRMATANTTHKINCSGASELTGTIYFPASKLRIDSNGSVAQESAFTAIIARTIDIDEGPDLVLNADYTATDVPVPEGLSGAAKVVLAD